MKLELGKRYVYRTGGYTKPLIKNESIDNLKYPFRDPRYDHSFTSYGEYLGVDEDFEYNDLDLVAEYGEDGDIKAEKPNSPAAEEVAEEEEETSNDKVDKLKEVKQMATKWLERDISDYAFKMFLEGFLKD